MAGRFYLRRAARLLPPPPGGKPQNQIQIQFLPPLLTQTFQSRQGDAMNLSYSTTVVFLTGVTGEPTISPI
jgi:hypothetical protein